MAESINFTNVVNATISVDNSADASRAYIVQADVLINDGVVVGYANGQAISIANGNHSCAFSQDAYSTTFSFMGQMTTAEKQSMLGGVEDFLESATASVPDLNLPQQ